MICPYPVNRDLGYVVGTLKGDGTCYVQKSRKRDGKWLNGNAHLMVLKVTDLVFAEKFNLAICRILEKRKLYSIGPMKEKLLLGKKKRYRVNACNKNFYLWFKNLQDENIKSLGQDKEFSRGFIEGVMDSEGSVGKYHITIRMKDFSCLKNIQQMLKKHFKINVEVKYWREGLFRLGVYMKNLRQIFSENIHSFKL